MTDELEFERQQLEHLIGKVGYSIIEGQENESSVTFKIHKNKAHWTKKRKRKLL